MPVPLRPPPRLFLLQAALAPVAVILRRGPSKDVEIVRRIIALSDGRVWIASVIDRRMQRFVMLVDLRDDRPEERRAPEWATQW